MFLNTGLYFYIHVLELLSAMTNIVALTEFHGVFVLIVEKWAGVKSLKLLIWAHDDHHCIRVAGSFSQSKALKYMNGLKLKPAEQLYMLGIYILYC